MQGGRRIFEKQFATRANPASQWSINDKLSLFIPPVANNYAEDNWLVGLDALVKATAVHARLVNILCILIVTAVLKVPLEQCYCDSGKCVYMCVHVRGTVCVYVFIFLYVQVEHVGCKTSS